MTRRKRVIGILALVLIAGAAGGAWWWRQRDDRMTEGILVIFGNVDIREVDLAVNGRERIAEVLAEEGDRVSAGQLLARLDTERFEYAVARAEAQVETQRQVVARLEAGTREEDIRRARADLDQAMVVKADAELTYQRELDAFSKQAAAQRELDDAKAAFDGAAARVRALEATLDLAIAGPRKEDIAEAKALLKRYEAELAIARHDLDDASLHAPANGVIRNRILEVGDMAAPDRPVYTMALMDPVWVRAYVPEPELGRIRPGMKASVRTDSFPGKTYDAWIGFISPTAEFTPKPVETTDVRTKLVYEVRAFVHNGEGELRLGMPATVTVPLDPRPGAEAQTSGQDD